MSFVGIATQINNKKNNVIGGLETGVGLDSPASVPTERSETDIINSMKDTGFQGAAKKVFQTINAFGLPSRSDQRITDAQFAARLRASSSGRAGTILTGKLGLTEQATVQKKTLLGQ